MRVTPKISDRPAATRNSADARGEPVERLEQESVERSCIATRSPPR